MLEAAELHRSLHDRLDDSISSRSFFEFWAAAGHSMCHQPAMGSESLGRQTGPNPLLSPDLCKIRPSHKLHFTISNRHSPATCRLRRGRVLPLVTCQPRMIRVSGQFGDSPGDTRFPGRTHEPGPYFDPIRRPTTVGRFALIDRLFFGSNLRRLRAECSETSFSAT